MHGVDKHLVVVQTHGGQRLASTSMQPVLPSRALRSGDEAQLLGSWRHCHHPGDHLWLVLHTVRLLALAVVRRKIRLHRALQFQLSLKLQGAEILHARRPSTPHLRTPTDQVPQPHETLAENRPRLV